MLVLATLLGVTGARAKSYEYDDAGRLVRVAYAEGGGVVYSDDESGNMTSVTPLDLRPAPAALSGMKCEVGAGMICLASPGAAPGTVGPLTCATFFWVSVAPQCLSLETGKCYSPDSTATPIWKNCLRMKRL